jgi:hypothetical protein
VVTVSKGVRQATELELELDPRHAPYPIIKFFELVLTRACQLFRRQVLVDRSLQSHVGQSIDHAHQEDNNQ